METLNKVCKIIAQVCGVDVNEVNENSAIGDFPQWDSIGHLTILSTIESQMGISFEPEEMMGLEDVKDIVRAVESK